MTSVKKIKVLLVHDHVIIRQGLRELFINQPDIEVVDDVETGENLLQTIDELKPNIAVIDINAPEINITAFIRQIIHKKPKIQIVALVTHPYIHLIEQAIKAGVCGFVSLGCSFNELAHAIRAVNKNQKYTCTKIQDILAKNYVNRMQTGSKSESLSLTEREYQIIRLLSKGMKSKTIATEMNVSFKTIDAYRRQIMRKLNIDNLVGLIKYAIRTGITSV
jgi:DNA-binding NarL/FixJ family response regulator